ncbi:MAG: O-antigen ligase family protein [Solirubrobacteraceae bacterium]
MVRSSWRPNVVAALPALVVVAVALVWSWSYGGFQVTKWYPGAIGLVLVLGALVAGLRPSLRELPRYVQVALAALALFTAWSFASILWADAQGVAWEGANRTLLYLVMFAIPVLSRLDGTRALLVVGAWTLGILVLAVWVLVKLPDAVGPGPAVLGPGLAAPIGYANAEACLWLMAAWPALVLASRPVVAPALRGLFAGGALVLFDVSLLSESGGALIAAGIGLVVLLVALPGRVRTLLTLVPVGIGAALTAPQVIDVSAERREAAAPIGELAALATPVLGVAVAVAVIVAVVAVLERRRLQSAATARRAGRGVAAVAVVVAELAVVALVVALVAATGNPVDSVRERWDSFKLGATVDPATGSLAGFGGARYDYYRVAADVIAEHPLGGVGADNFAQDYAAAGRALEFPAYVHSVELRTLVHTGLVGGLALVIAFGAALLGALRAARAGPAAGAAAAAATMVFVHWFVQGSADWFWEFPALGGAAFAMLGVACGLAARRRRDDGVPGLDADPTHVSTGGASQRDSDSNRPAAPDRELDRDRAAESQRGGEDGRVHGPFWRPVAAVVAVIALLAACASLVAPWSSAILTDRAGNVWPIDDGAAFRQLELAADLNPLSARPALTEGTIALRLNRLDRARDAFTSALDRDPRDAYATLALGAIASARGDRARALDHLRRAQRLNRQDGVTIGALQAVRDGRRIDIPALLDQFELLAREARR